MARRRAASRSLCSWRAPGRGAVFGPDYTGLIGRWWHRSDREVVALGLGDFLVSWIIEELAVAVEPERVDRLHSLNRRESRRASDRIFADLLDQYGEHEMAERFRTDPLEHARRREVGRRFFFGAEGAEPPGDPAWLKEFVEVISISLLADRATGHLGIRYREVGGHWEISVYPTQGGGGLEEAEGSAASPGCAWDVEELRSVFDRIDGVGWYAVCPGGAESPYVWIEGDYQDHEVFLRLPPGEPDHVEPGETCEVWSVGRG